MEQKILNIKKAANKLLETLEFHQEPVVVVKRDNSYLVRLEMDSPGYLIGRQGEVLDAFQHILRLLINDLVETNEHLIVDVNNYRERKTKNLERRAKELAYYVQETKQEAELPNLNSYERRVVHSIVNAIADIESESRGDGQDRKVVIRSKNKKS